MKKKTTITRLFLSHWILLFNCWSLYGFRYGIILFAKLKFPKFKTFRLPNVKYPFTIRNIYEDIHVFEQIFLAASYDIDCKAPQVIIDAGANIGLSAIYFKNRYPDAKIICIEPDRENFELLKQNVSLYENIFCENCGLWHKDAMLKAYDNYGLGKWGIVVKEDENGTIPAISVETIMEKYNLSQIDVLKLDIEGSEKYLFSSNYENWLKKTNMLIVELHDRMLDGCSQTFFNTINSVYKNYNSDISAENIIIEQI